MIRVEYFMLGKNVIVEKPCWLFVISLCSAVSFLQFPIRPMIGVEEKICLGLKLNPRQDMSLYNWTAKPG